MYHVVSTPAGLRSYCPQDQRYGKYNEDFRRSKRLGSFEVRWTVLKIRVALDADFTVSSTIGQCDWYGRWSVGAGAGLSGEGNLGCCR